MCQTLKEFKHIKKLLEKNSKINFSCNFVLRNNPKFLYIKDLIDKGVLGKIYLIEGDYNYGRLYKLTMERKNTFLLCFTGWRFAYNRFNFMAYESKAN